MQNECKQFIASLADAHIEVGNRINNNVLTIDQANDLVSKEVTFLILQHEIKIRNLPWYVTTEAYKYVESVGGVVACYPVL